MKEKIKFLLEQDIPGGHISPFFWQHGEDEVTLRHYMRVIQDSGCGGVCIESRPHPDFCGPGWWHDLDIILDEARRRQMQVWILDDRHFPTGFANGALVDAPAALCRQSVFCHEIVLDDDDRHSVELDIAELCTPPELPMSQLAAVVSQMTSKPRHFENDEVLLSITAIQNDRHIDLTNAVQGNRLIWEKPKGRWTVCVCGLSHNCGPHRDYINMVNRESCRILIDAVYEPHWQHYQKDFGNTIAGFFSDEPELGNGILYMQHNLMGTPQDLPWSIEVEQALCRSWGDTWKQQLPYLWHTQPHDKKAAALRYEYMDVVTRLVQRDFSEQIGDWCRTHGVQYIGHVIEDEGQHCRTASSLGHYFRGLAGQDMAGIDDIGGQVMPGGEDEPTQGPMGRTRSGEFYHYGLASLAASAAAIEPPKAGRAMCEIFGNYGWKAGLKLQKYLADHFLVRGINYFVPHAFSPKTYPDPDCPPHFYAQGNNPQYRYFGKLIRYMNRVCELISDGHRMVSAAILYHGESEWVGHAMPFEKPLRKLYDRQICCDVIPDDVFRLPDTYHTKIGQTLHVNTQEYSLFILPESQYIPAATAQAVAALHKAGMPVLFVNRFPEGVCNGDDHLLDPLTACPVVALDKLPELDILDQIQDCSITPENNRIRVLHYEGETPVYMLVNEGDSSYHGTLRVPSIGSCCQYDAMENLLRPLHAECFGDRTEIPFTLPPFTSLIVLFDNIPAERLTHAPEPVGDDVTPTKWSRSQCRSIDYPAFENTQTISLPDHMADEQPNFSGFMRYEAAFEAASNEPYLLNIEDADEGVEVFVNGHSLGLQFVAPMRFDLTPHLKDGKNQLTIEVATTLERERYIPPTNVFEQALISEPTEGSGLTGTVQLLRLK